MDYPGLTGLLAGLTLAYAACGVALVSANALPTLGVHCGCCVWLPGAPGALTAYAVALAFAVC